MRRAHKVWADITAGVFTLVVIGDLAAPGPTMSPVPGARHDRGRRPGRRRIRRSRRRAELSRRRGSGPARVVRRAAPPAAAPRTVTVS